MKVYSQLISAALEVKSSDHSTGVVGLIWWNSTSKQVKVGTTTSSITNFLLNNEACVFGTNGTANNNIRFHRGAAGVLQFVPGGNTTSEGTLATSLNQISARVENYTDAGKPSAGNAGRIVYISDLTSLKFDDGTNWQTLASNSAADKLAQIYDAVVGTAGQVSSGIATHSTLSSAISAVSAGDTIYMLDTTITENISLTKKVYIQGKGNNSVLSGTFTFASGSGKSIVKNIKISDNITINSGVNSVLLSEVYTVSGKLITDNGTANWIFALEE